MDDTKDERNLHLVTIEILNAVGGGEPDRVHSHGIGSTRVRSVIFGVQHELLGQDERRAVTSCEVLVDREVGAEYVE